MKFTPSLFLRKGREPDGEASWTGCNSCRAVRRAAHDEVNLSRPSHQIVFFFLPPKQEVPRRPRRRQQGRRAASPHRDPALSSSSSSSPVRPATSRARPGRRGVDVARPVDLLLRLQGAFERRRYMNVVVQKAVHPQLAGYIHSATSGLLPFIQKGLVERVVVIFYDKAHVPVEKFVFKLAVNQSYGSKVEEANLEFALRAFLIKLTVAEPLTRPLPSDGSWEITAYFQSLPPDGEKEAQLWIPTDTKQWMQPPQITPIKSMSCDPVKMQLYLEQPSRTEPRDPPTEP
uniref:HORMA domain-containing protein n=1 Tax=Oryza meridionalis TaxID=40149 RepID=A0A0E0ENE4_9ORYZ